MSIRLGIVGAGTIGSVHAAGITAAGHEVAAVADVDRAKANLLAARHARAHATDRIEVLLADESIAAVVIAVPNRWHKDLAVAAMRAGKDVLLEKPMGLDAAECRELNEVAAATGRVLQIGMANRFTAVGQEAKKIAESGDLGHVYHAKAHLVSRRGVPGLGGWFTTRSLSGGGVLIDTGVHLVDLLLWLMDFPRVERISGRVYSIFGKRMEDYVYESMWAGPPRFDGVCDVEDSAHAMLHFAGGGTLDLNVSWAINMPACNIQGGGMMGLFGDRGGVTFELFGDHLDVATQRYGRNVDTRVMLPEVDQFKEQVVAFVRCVETREEPCAHGQQGQCVQSILDAIYQSSEKQQEVTLERKK